MPTPAITVALILLGSERGCPPTPYANTNAGRCVSIALRYSMERADMGRHDGHHDDAVTVADLFARIAAEGRALRLNWTTTDTDPHGLATVDHDWPTAVLRAIEGDMASSRAAAGGAAAIAGLPRREPGAIPPPTEPVHATTDSELLGRILRGLRRLE